VNIGVFETESENEMKEQNELLEAALKWSEGVKELVRQGTAIAKEDEELLVIIEKHRPAPKVLDGWVGLYQAGNGGFNKDKHVCESDYGRAVRFIHVREVLPWKKWTLAEITRLETCKEIINLHNAEMLRVTGREGE
jgi:hypothetical protein